MRTERPQIAKFPLMWISASFAIGILLENSVGFDLWISSAVCAVSVLTAFLLRKRGIDGLATQLAFAALGALTLQVATCNVSADRVKRIYDAGQVGPGEPVEVEGVLRGKPEPTYNGFFLTLNTDRLTVGDTGWTVSGRVRLFVPLQNRDSEKDFRALDLDHLSRIKVATRLEREERFLNPGVAPAKELLDQQEIDATAVVKSPLLIKKLDSRMSILSPIFGLRQNLIEEIKTHFNTPTAGVLIASLLGNKYFLDKDTATVFREGGTFHILVVSGLHVTFIGGLIVLVIRRFTRNRWLVFLVPTVMLWAYTIAVGGEVPAVRASLMFTALLFSQVIYRRGTMLNFLGLSAIILLAWRPQDLFTPSFQLTFVSVAAIVALAFPLIDKLRAMGSWIPTAQEPFPPDIPRWLHSFCEMLYWRDELWQIELGRQIWTARVFKYPYLNWIRTAGLQQPLAIVFEGLLMSLIVQICMLPLMVWYFHLVSVASIFLNLWVGFFIALESFSALAALLVEQGSHLLAFPLFRITELFSWLLLAVPRIVAEDDWGVLRPAIYSGGLRIIYIVYFIPLAILAYALFRWNPFGLGPTSVVRQPLYGLSLAAGIAVAVLSFIIVFHPYSAPEPDGRLSVSFLDVGQGDAALITFPTGETMLVDGGGRVNYSDDEEFEPDVPRIGERVVSEFLWEKGYADVDILLGTHAHADHIQGLADVAANFDVGMALFGEIPVGNPEFEELTSHLSKREVPIRRISAGDSFEIGGVAIEFRNPASGRFSAALSDNNQSVVIRLVFGDRAFLLTGDIEGHAESFLVELPKGLRADVVKIPHHGSRTSSTAPFIEAIQAEYAVVSVGKRSRFGHPHREVVDRWTLAGATLIKTGDKGTVTFSTDGKDLKVETLTK